MAESTAEVIVGGAVLAAAVGFLVYAGQVTGFAAGTRGAYELTASFRSAEGLAVGTDVRIAGVKVGTVTALGLDPATFRAEARFTVREDLVLPDDTTAAVASEGLLGGAYLELLPGGSPLTLAPGEEVLDTQSAVSVLNLLLKFATGGGQDAAAPAGAGE
jgi:phospholipid/cholesterol/gamma-HCH transport system substrate-binding protein